jgi:hypothetical protein
VGADDGDEDDRDEHHVPEEHLAEIHQVEERAQPGGVYGVLAVGGDPLRVEVLLGEVPGEALDDRGEKGDHAADPGERPAAPPGGHPELPHRWMTMSAMNSGERQHEGEAEDRHHDRMSTRLATETMKIDQCR